MTMVGRVRTGAAAVVLLALAAAEVRGVRLEPAGQTSSSSLYYSWRRSDLCIADGKERVPRLLDRTVVEEMLKLASVTAIDHVIDLTFGDGLLAFVAALKYNARATVVPVCRLGVEEARGLAGRDSVRGRIDVRNEDFFKMDLSGATVVTLFLLPTINDALLPKLRKELRPGTRIVSWSFSLGDWEPDRTILVQPRKHTLLLWTVR